MYKSDLINILANRGFIYQSVNLENLDNILCTQSIKGYVGFDATANSLHVGSLTVLMIAKWMQLTGNNPILLLGGGTTKVGDPSWRNKERPLLSDEQVDTNISSISNVFSSIVSFIGDNKAEVINNADWLEKINYIDFLRNIGIHFSINKMLSFEHIRSRLAQEAHLSFIEFNYILMQSFDFLQLFQYKNCILQWGGSDQWGNIVSGVDLIRRVLGEESYAFTTPLVMNHAGEKMGKTANGAVWLDANLVSPYEYWQFWRNTNDHDVERFLKLFTLLPLEYINDLCSVTGSQLNNAKIVLADHATELLHGKDKLSGIHATIKSIFNNDGKNNDNNDALPSFHVNNEDIISDGLNILEALMMLDFINSKREGRQFIRDGLVSVNNIHIQNELCDLMDILHDNKINSGMIKISIGKKKHGIIKID